MTESTSQPELTSTPERDNEAVTYEQYRYVVDSLNPAFRETGIVDAASFDRAMRDPRTVKLRVAGEVVLPLVVPMEHVSGYDVERTKKLTGSDQVAVLSTPLAALTAQDAEILPLGDSAQPGQMAIIVETDHEETADVQRILPDVLQSLGQYAPTEFRDTRIDNPESQTAFMGIYESRFAAVDENGERAAKKDNNFLGGYDKLVADGYELTQHAALLDVHKLREDENLVDELWELCKDRFEWLGEGHPVSMEDTKDFFVHVVLHEDTHTLVRYDEEGKPACLGFFISGLKECDWLSSQFRAQMEAEAAKRGEEILYFHGIASNSKNAAHYARDIVQLLSKICNEMGGECHLLFESTNMSSQYIPQIVAQYVEESDGVKATEPMHQLARMDYWYLRPQIDSAA